MEMTKPFDWQVLLERLKSKGLVAVEADVKIMTEELFGWATDSLNLEPNPMFKVGIPVLEFIKPLALKLEDKIDGVEGN